MAKKKSENAKTRLSKVKFEAEKQMKAMQEAAEKRAAELQKQIEEAEAAALKAEEEEAKLLADTQAGIEKLCKDGGYFCGVIMDKNILLQLVDMSIENAGQNIKIPFRLYNIEDQEQEQKTENSKI